ncbi:MAG: hypothetical protein AAGF98_12615 [Cyanobacteria bacterium P01_H01_bin.153]
MTQFRPAAIALPISSRLLSIVHFIPLNSVMYSDSLRPETGLGVLMARLMLLEKLPPLQENHHDYRIR